MYIEYITPQRVADTNFTKYDSRGGSYRPTWLIRTLDWKKVPGHHAIDGYHTLSYCWEQSGEKVEQDDGEFILIDDCGHRITKKDGERLVTYGVKYDQLLQRICFDFHIRYLWYDKCCIDQTNKGEKIKEIKQMHLIYSNACYTVALVPEIYIDDPKEFDCNVRNTKATQAKIRACTQMYGSLWWKRSWTLEEVTMSTQILIVGRNTHFWSLADIKQGRKIKEDELLANYMLGFKEREPKNANQVLTHAHFRTSTKEHDKIFALTNIFNGTTDIDINYHNDISSAMNKFYRKLAQHDLTVMCFGSNLNPLNGQPLFTTTMAHYNLPSWTGVGGLHLSRPITDVTVDHSYNYTIDDHMRLHIRCRSRTIRPIKTPNCFGNGFTHEKRAPEENMSEFKAISAMASFRADKSAALEWSQWSISQTTRCYNTHFWKPDSDTASSSSALIMSLTEECDECIVLGVIFSGEMKIVRNGVRDGSMPYHFSPVVKVHPNTLEYKSIGVILLRLFERNEHRDSPQETMNKIFRGEATDFAIH